MSLHKDSESLGPRKLSEANINRRDDILQATERVLRREGYAGLTARKIASEAGFSLGHITYNFTGMDEVLSETYRRLTERLHDHMTCSNSDPGDLSPPERLEAFLAAGFTPEFLDPGHLRLRIDFWSAALTSQAIARSEAVLYSHYRSTLMALLQAVADQSDGADAGSNDGAGAPARLRGNTRTHRRQAEIPMLADTLMATLDGLWLDWMRRHDEAGIRNGLAGSMALVRAVLT